MKVKVIAAYLPVVNIVPTLIIYRLKEYFSLGYQQGLVGRESSHLLG